jgi:hypothetical protein
MAVLDQPFDANSALPEGLPEAEKMNPREKALRDMFVSEYLIDFDQVKAAMRCGFNQQFAVEYSRKFMEESYVQKRINEVRFMKTDEKALAEFDKARILSSLMAEAHYHGPGSSQAARVAALGKLAIMYGMEVKRVEATVQHRGGVMAVPGIASLDDWEKQASASQDELVRDASDDGS